MNQIVDEIKSKITLSSIVSRKVSLSKKSNGDYLGLCPFHGEKTPSFTVNDSIGSYYCFGCHAKGDVISYVVESEKLEFKDAIKLLAAEAGVTIKEIKKKSRYEFLYEINEIITKHYQNCLTGEYEKYLTIKRNISKETIARFKIGFAPNNQKNLLTKLMSKFSEAQILESKLFAKGDYGIYPFFRDRIIFPIFDIQGRIIAFGGRVIEKAEPKYLNSSDTPIFHKKDNLYNLSKEMRKKQIVIVEGYMDVISLYQHGIKNAVAPLGTSLTTNQLELLWNYTEEPILCLDNDSAGQKSMMRVAKDILPIITPAKLLKFLKLKNAKDPDEILNNGGKEVFANLLKNSLPLSEFLFQENYGSEKTESPEQKAKFKLSLSALSDLIKDDNLKKMYKKFFNDRCYEEFYLKKFSKKNTSKQIAIKLQQPDVLLIKTIFLTIANHPDILNDIDITNELHDLIIEDSLLDNIREYILSSHDHENISFENVEEKFGIKFNEKYDLFTTQKSTNDEAKEGIMRSFKILKLHILKNK